MYMPSRTMGPLLAVLFFCGPVAAQDRVGAVDSLFGAARAGKAKIERSLASGDAVFLNETVLTAEQSRLALQLGASTRINLGSSTRLRLDRYIVGVGGTLTLRDGAMFFDRPGGASPESLKIRGDFGEIAVRGTRFFVGPSRGRLAVFVERGAVTVTSGGATVALGPGQGTEIARRGERPQPVQVWGEGRRAEALDLVR
jgi:ferric-dicitrate binding protein FerR (iron transport regulator)